MAWGKGCGEKHWMEGTRRHPVCILLINPWALLGFPSHWMRKAQNWPEAGLVELFISKWQTGQ